jgi:hypothetical protein
MGVNNLVNNLIAEIENRILAHQLDFTKKPIIIGGKAMEFYGMRNGADIDLVICDADYQKIATKHPNNRKDIWGDLGVAMDEIEVWRSIYFFDYEFFLKDAIEVSSMLVISLDRLLFTRSVVVGCVSEVEKRKEDFEKVVQYYHDNLRNQEFYDNAKPYFDLYKSSPDGTILRGQYEE